jgi:uncharacterized membrane protein
LTAIVFILTGILAYQNPNLIAGFRQLSDKQKKKLYSHKLASYAKYVLISIGLVIMITNLAIGHFYPSYETLTYALIIGLGIFFFYTAMPKLN